MTSPISALHSPNAHCDTDVSRSPGAPRARRPQLSVPALEAWPEAVRSAELLRGTVVRCGPGVRPIAWPDTPRVRLAALAPWLGSFIAVGLTAAWVWGAARTPGPVLECSTADRKRPPATQPPGVRVRQLALAGGDIVQIGRGRATTPTRTLCDLLRADTPASTVERVACRLLLSGLSDGRPAAHAAITSGPVRQRRVAIERLREL